tara:strand:- start:455 stop:1090 length:636 start_codon:yes stop_codon:yes gene_type:complete
MKDTTKKTECNLKLWQRVEVTNPAWLKTANISGRKISAINPQKQLKQATEIFGYYGQSWGLMDCRREILDLENSIKLIIFEAVFFYPGGSFEISNSIKLCYLSAGGKYIVDTEAFKKVETNTISKALSKLGFSSDVYEGRFEVEGYEKIADYATDTILSQAERKAAEKVLKQAATAAAIIKIWATKKTWHTDKELIEIYKTNLSTLQKAEK